MANHHGAAWRVIEWALRLGIGGLFVYAGFIKASDPTRFVENIEAYRLLPYRAAVAFALYVPYVELICGIALITGWLRDGATALTALLVALFIAAASNALVRGIDVSCGCFGETTGTTHALWLIGRNLLILIGLGALCLLRLSKPLSSKDASNVRSAVEGAAPPA